MMTQKHILKVATKPLSAAQISNMQYLSYKRKPMKARSGVGWWDFRNKVGAYFVGIKRGEKTDAAFITHDPSKVLRRSDQGCCGLSIIK